MTTSNDPDAIYRDIELTHEEIEAAILEGKKRKYFREKHKDYWEEKEHGTRRDKGIQDGPDDHVTHGSGQP